MGPENLVALALPRSKRNGRDPAGHPQSPRVAHPPLDPDYPAERLAYMLQDAQPACVLTSARIAQRLPGVSSPGSCFITRTRSGALAQQPETDPSDAERTGPLTPQNPAYVIYTSGSTGTPKGVVIMHASLLGSRGGRPESADRPH